MVKTPSELTVINPTTGNYDSTFSAEIILTCKGASAVNDDYNVYFQATACLDCKLVPY